MECLGIPIDHRLRRLIREARPTDTNGGDSDHLRILQEFGTSLKSGGDDYLNTFDLSFGIEMARPESKGGVVVVLLQPHSTQNNSDGFLAGRRRCPTINAVSELISVVSNGRLGFDDISVFDAIPFLDENVTEKDSQDIIDEAQSVFANMIKAKQPKVVISCFKTNTSNAILKCLRCRRIGYCFEFDPPGSKQLVHSGLSLIRVNAFHPSYAINRNPQFSCFKRLLVLEFTKAFALWQQNWVDEKWMSLLRDECSKQAKELSKGIFSASRYLKNYSDNFFILAQDNHGHLNEHYINERWTNLLVALEAGIMDCFFHESGSSLAEIAESCWHRLVDSKITWICCDIAWSLNKQQTSVLKPRQLCHYLKCWCQKSWPEANLQRNSTGCIGYYDHSALLLLKSKETQPRARKLENIFYTFLRDMNLSYSRSGKTTFCKIGALADAFRRFAAAFENILEETQEAISQRDHELCNKMNSLGLDR